MNPILLDLPMPILTPRLMIRPRVLGEGAVIAAAINSSIVELKAWMPWAQGPNTVEEAEENARRSLAEYILRERMNLSIYLRPRSGNEPLTFVGSTGYNDPNWSVPSVAIGYWIATSHAGKGYATEAAHALTRYAFDFLKCQRVEIRCDATNERSLSVMKRLGFVEEARLRNEDRRIGGKLRDTVITARVDTAGLPPLDVIW